MQHQDTPARAGSLVSSRATPRRHNLLGLALGALALLAAGPGLAQGASSAAAEGPRKRARAAEAPESAPAPPADVVIEPATPAPADSSPLNLLSKSHDRLQKLIAKKSPDWSPEGEAKNSELRQLIGDFIDFGELARRSLPRHWDGLTGEQRGRFVTTLRELVERNYLTNIHSSPKYKMTWEKEALQPTEASVTASVESRRKGKPVNLALEYKLLHKARGWVVYDVITDEQSMVETYRAEFTKIIRKESFDGLLDRMQRKLSESVAKGG